MQEDSKRIGQEAAKKGTEIHAMIEMGFLEKVLVKLMK